MAMTKAEQAAILARDAARRAERDALDNARLGIDVTNTMSDAYKIAHAPKDAHVNPCLVRSIGVVCPPPKTSASQNCWTRGMRGTTKGVAPGSTDPTPSMRVTYADGTSHVVPVTNSRKNATHRRKTTTVNVAPTTPETARIKLDHNFND